MVAWGVLVLDVIVLSSASLLFLVCISYIIAGWLIRTHFEMAVRSPLLLTMSGFAGVFQCFATVVQIILYNATEPGIPQLLLVPMAVTLNTSAYIMRGVRLLVMYDPALRERYWPYLKELVMVKALVLFFGAIEILVWSLSLVFGVRRIASFTMVTAALDGMLTIVAILVLTAKLRTTNDLFEMSSEIQSVGACLLGFLALIAISFVAPANLQGFVLITAVLLRFYATMWISNVRPLRTIMRQRVGSGGNTVTWFPYVPWRRPLSKVVVGAGQASLLCTAAARGSGANGGFDLIMGCPPLLRAFEEYCRQALCSESIMFLIEASEFEDALDAATAEDIKLENLERFQAVVDKYVKDGAPFEVNISSKTKATILEVAAVESDEKSKLSQVLAPAVKEIGDMLKDNLYNRFRTTAEYRQVASSFEYLA